MNREVVIINLIPEPERERTEPLYAALAGGGDDDGQERDATRE